jgi:hypothetical protein
MMNFTFDTYQVNVQLNDDGNTGRCIIDGQMNLKQFEFIYTFPLRVIVVYDFRLLGSQNVPQFEIFKHEEMWSVVFSFYISYERFLTVTFSF